VHGALAKKKKRKRFTLFSVWADFFHLPSSQGGFDLRVDLLRRFAVVGKSLRNTGLTKGLFTDLVPDKLSQGI
jgi:hypothetical protein